jgi:acetyl esterase/lipase
MGGVKRSKQMSQKPNPFFNQIRKKSLIVLLVLFAFGHGIQAQRITIERDIVYAHRDGLDLMLDIGNVTGHQGKIPALIFLPGNAWGWAWGSSWNRNQYYPVLGNFALEGYVAISIDYSPISIKDGEKTKFPFPTQLYDVKNAIRWVRAHAEQYGIDPEKIGLLGWSSGAHLALLDALTRPEDNMDGDINYPAYSASVQAVVAIGADTDLLVEYEDYPKTQPPSRDILVALIGGTPSDKPDMYRIASPITYARIDSPPILSIMGMEDAPKLAQMFDSRMKEVGAIHTLVLVNDMGHENAWDDDAVIPFFNKWLKNGK